MVRFDVNLNTDRVEREQRTDVNVGGKKKLRAQLGFEPRTARKVLS